MSAAIIGACVVLFALYYGVAMAGPNALGLWQDDGIYACTAQAIAEGADYRHIEIPGEPLQTKYPIAYPAMLALGMVVAGAYPSNLWLLHVPAALAAAGLVVIAVLYLRKVFPERTRTIWMAGALAALSPAIVSLVRFTMSDLPYAALAAAALYVVDIKCHEYDTKRRWWWTIAGSLLAGTAMLTRGIGITLAGAIVVNLAMRRRFKQAVVAALLLITCFGAWQVRQRQAAKANGSLQESFLVAPEMSYSMWLPDSASQTLRTVAHNTLSGAFGLVYFQLAFPEGAVQSALQQGGWRLVGLHVLCYGAVGLALWSFAASARKRLLALHWYAVFYAGLALAWPFQPYRFLDPWTPFILFFLLDGVWRVAALIARPLAVGGRGRVATWVSGVVALVLLGVFVVEDARIAGSSADAFHLRGAQANLTELENLEHWIAGQTEAGDIVASSMPARLFLATGRQGHYFWPDSDPYRQYYGVDRSAAMFYVIGGPSEQAYLAQQINERALAAYRAGQVDYYVEQAGLSPASLVMGQFVRSHPEAFEPVYRTPKGVFTVFAFQSGG